MSERTNKVDLQTERFAYTEKIRTMQETPGWSKLSEDQQDVIRLTLYATDRVKRRNGKNREYELSKNVLKRNLCHTAIMMLETAGIDDFDDTELPNHVDRDFFVEKKIDVFNDPKKYETLVGAILQSEFPIVVQPGFSPKLGTYPHAHHSFLVLGPDSKGQIICWDKEGRGADYSFRLVDFSEEFRDYERSSSWGIRKLRNLDAVEKWSLDEKI